MEISFCSHPNTKKVIATIFGTWHDSWAVVACAKFCRDIIISNWIRAKWNFHRIWIVMEKSLVKWVPGSKLESCGLGLRCARRPPLMSYALVLGIDWGGTVFSLYGAPTLIARFMEPSWGPLGAGRTQVGPMLAPWTLLSRWCWDTEKELLLWTVTWQFIGLMQDCSNFIANELGLLQSCTKPSKCSNYLWACYEGILDVRN